MPAAMEHAIEHLHRRGFARAIFADDPMDCAWFDAKVYAVIGDARPKSLGQAAQFDGWECAGSHGWISRLPIRAI